MQSIPEGRTKSVRGHGPAAQGAVTGAGQYAPCCALSEQSGPFGPPAARLRAGDRQLRELPRSVIVDLCDEGSALDLSQVLQANILSTQDVGGL